MNLFIIGNGFDLRHNLPTSYGDFRNYVKKNDEQLYEKIYEMYKNSILKHYSYPCDDVALDAATNQPIDEYKMLWQDIERNMEIANDGIILDVDEDLGLEMSYDGDKGYEDTMEIHISEIYSNMPERLRDNLKNWISQIETKNILKKTSKISEQGLNLFLNFNYTLLLEETYEIEPSQICHIHESVKDSTLIMGHKNHEKIKELSSELEFFEESHWSYEDEEEEPIYISENTEEKIKRLKVECLKKLYEETLKNTDTQIEMYKYFFKDLKDVKNIYVIGHSLGEVDFPYFREIIKVVNKNVKWNISYYLEKEKKEFKDIAIKKFKIEEKNLNIFPSDEFYDIDI